MLYDVIIVGGGPAGVSTAIQLARANIECLIIEKNNIGGLIRNANLIENYIGFPNGITGADFVSLIQEHLVKYNVKVAKEEVIEVNFDGFVFNIRTSTNSFQSKFLVVASGSIPKTLNIEGENKYLNKYVFYDYLQLADLSNKDIIIIGGGDSSYDYALNLAKRQNNISIAIKGESSKCIHSLLRMVEKNSLIKQYYNFLPKNFCLDKNKIILENILGEPKKLSADFILISIGRTPNNSFLDEKLLNEFTNHGKQNENIPIYFIGDVINERYRQISISTGDGIKCAMRIATLY